MMGGKSKHGMFEAQFKKGTRDAEKTQIGVLGSPTYFCYRSGCDLGKTG